MYAQYSNPYDVINCMEEQINSKFYILDSLTALKKLNLKKSSFDFLKKKEKREIKQLLREATGFKLSPDSLTGKKLYSANAVFDSFEKYDSLKEKEIEKIQPFYIVSNPIFFNRNKKAVIFVILSRDAGCLYFLEKKASKWAVIKSILQWM
jgi:hypothetical protein